MTFWEVLLQYQTSHFFSILIEMIFFHVTFLIWFVVFDSKDKNDAYPRLLLVIM